MLKVGDVLVEFNGKYLCIERKTMKDFRDSTFDGRLAEQPVNMAKEYDYRVVFIVGTYEEYYIETEDETFTEEMYNGKIASLGLKYTVPPVTVNSDKHFWRMVRSWAYRLEIAGEPLVTPTILPPKSRDPHVMMLRCIDGIGEDTAIRILEMFEWDELKEATVDDLMMVKGIGKAYAERIIEWI